MSTLSFIFEHGAVKRQQQAMIRSLMQRGLKGKDIASELCVCQSYVSHVLDESDTYFSRAEHHIALLYLCSAMDDDTHIEQLLAGRKCVSPIPEVPYNGSTDDEILDGVEAIGRTRFESMRGNWSDVMAFGWHLISVGWRLVVHAKKKLGQEVGQVHAAMAPAPLFDYSGGGAR